MCNFCDEELPLNTLYGAIWIDSKDKIGNFKWMSKQCPPYAECRENEMVNTCKIKFCPMCGKKLS